LIIDKTISLCFNPKKKKEKNQFNKILPFFDPKLGGGGFSSLILLIFEKSPNFQRHKFQKEKNTLNDMVQNSNVGARVFFFFFF